MTRDLTGFTKGTYTYVKDAPRVKGQRRIIIIKCKCGEERQVVLKDFVRKSRPYLCHNCKKNKPKKLSKYDVKIGDKNGMLTILELNIDGSLPLATVKCDCGNVKQLNLYDFLYGATKSCGCLIKDKYRKFTVIKTIMKSLKNGYSPKQVASILKLDELKVLEVIERQKNK